MIEIPTSESRGYIVASGIPIDDSMRLRLSEDGESVMCGDMIVQPSLFESTMEYRNSWRAKLASTPMGQKILAFLPEIREFEHKQTEDGRQGYDKLTWFIKERLNALGLSTGPDISMGVPAVFLENGDSLPLVSTVWAEEEDLRESARRLSSRDLVSFQDDITSGSARFLTFYRGHRGVHGVGPDGARRIRREIITALSSSEPEDRLIEMVCRAKNGYVPDSEDSIEFFEASQIVSQKDHWLSFTS